MCSDEELGGIEEILPEDVCGSTEGREGIEEGLRHPDTEGGVFLSESLSGGDRADTGHGLGCRCRVDEYVLIVASFGRRGQFIADPFAETKLKETGDERT